MSIEEVQLNVTADGGWRLVVKTPKQVYSQEGVAEGDGYHRLIGFNDFEEWNDQGLISDELFQWLSTAPLDLAEEL